MLDPVSAKDEKWLSDGTTALAIGWIALTVYGFLCTLTSSGMPLRGWFGLVITLLVVWSVMERKRWGRLALFDIALLTLADAAYAVYRLTTAPHVYTISSLRDAPTLVIVLRAYDGGPLFGLALLALCAVTMLWLMWSPVRAEFERRKRITTRRFQVCIALVLVGIWIIGKMSGGVSSAVKGLPRDPLVQRVQTMQPEPLETIPVELRASEPGERR